ncbi:AcrR family transcriptional regulator [Prauserella sediminis]|uniref:AcrR family transcriptional regulator n=1 Tax=Prauserella sediminis TaxID=577680 RepID=A0A839XSL5_9PSEU|nr:TetR/AcrR family transcriptional regulator [Prauserella sediminis]MBB3664434.1 AcrR family transcriptional regulator [Prauserella sediminis]
MSSADRRKNAMTATKPTMPSRRPNRAGLEARQRIMEAAVRLFAENGYHGTGIEMVSGETGIGRGALYHHIGSKENLLFEICHHRMSDLLERSRRIVATDAGAEVRFRELMRATVRNLAENTSEWVVTFQEFKALTGRRKTVIQEAREQYEEIVDRLLREGAETGEFARLDPLVTKAVLGLYNYSYAWLRPDGERTPEEVADLFTDALLAGISSGSVPPSSAK